MRTVGILLAGTIGMLTALLAISLSALLGGPNLLDPVARCAYRLPADLPPKKCRVEHAIDQLRLEPRGLSRNVRRGAAE